MWWPKSVDELRAAFEAGDLVESQSLELKRELPGKGKSADLACDISAMTPEGGVLLYGVGDADATADSLRPFPLEGQRDRIFQIVGSGVAEVPQLDVIELVDSGDGESRRGYLVVLVPPSARAPHMVTIKGDRRFYGRNGTQNIRLGEGEVARLYQRRNRVAADLDEMLDALIASSTLAPDERYGELHFFAAPAFEDDGFLERVRAEAAEPGNEQFPAVLTRHLRRAQAIAPGRGMYAPSTEGWTGWHPTSGGYCLSGAPGNEPDLSQTKRRDALKVEVAYTGAVLIVCGCAVLPDPAGNVGGRYIFEALIAGLVTQALALAGALAETCGYLGQISTGVSVLGLAGGVSEDRFGPGRVTLATPTPYDRDEYRRVHRLSAMALAGNPHPPAAALLTPLFRTTLGPGHEGMIDRFRP